MVVLRCTEMHVQRRCRSTRGAEMQRCQNRGSEVLRF